ncbi:hypothetical protein [Streptomyces sp. NPDC005283]|uniref:hypothetical protein n=1 Tax=Streptomyces sp. NPDC005283 TaxID=3156871 RepID=UPI003453FEFD
MRKCDADLHEQLYASIVLTSGTSQFPGLPERLYKELLDLAPSGTDVEVITPSERRYGAWTGGSALSSQKPFDSQWVTRDLYLEQGGAGVA